MASRHGCVIAASRCSKLPWGIPRRQIRRSACWEQPAPSHISIKRPRSRDIGNYWISGRELMRTLFLRKKPSMNSQPCNNDVGNNEVPLFHQVTENAAGQHMVCGSQCLSADHRKRVGHNANGGAKSRRAAPRPAGWNSRFGKSNQRFSALLYCPITVK